MYLSEFGEHFMTKKNEELVSHAGYPLTIKAAADGLKSGRWTSAELLLHSKEQADLYDGVLGTHVTQLYEQSIPFAEEADVNFAAGVVKSELQGIPIGVKDLIDVRGAPTTAQSRVTPTQDREFDAFSVKKMRDVGSLIVGKTTTMEFGFGAPDPKTGFPLPRSPYDQDRWAGGSSSGNANGVVTSQFLGSLGTDTAGSLRLPAAWGGITGFKPTFGLVSRTGSIPLATSFDTIGPMARSAYDCALILQHIHGRDDNDYSTMKTRRTDFIAGLNQSLVGMKIGVDPQIFEAGSLSSEILQGMRQALEVFKSAGAKIKPISVPLAAEMKTATIVAWVSEALTVHMDDLVHRGDEYGSPARLALVSGLQISATDYIQAQRVRRKGIEQVTKLFEDFDLYISPTSLGISPLLKDLNLDAIAGAANTHYWSATGFPTISIPAGFTSENLPFGLQLSGKPFSDTEVLNAAHQFQSVTSYHLAQP